MTDLDPDVAACDPEIADLVVRVFADGQQRRRDAVGRAWITLRPYERRLVHEAAVMGYVRGALAGRAGAALNEPRETDIPTDTDMIFEVVGACLAMPDRYPYLAAAANGRRRRITRARRWPGEEPS